MNFAFVRFILNVYIDSYPHSHEKNNNHCGYNKLYGHQFFCPGVWEAFC